MSSTGQLDLPSMQSRCPRWPTHLVSVARDETIADFMTYFDAFIPSDLEIQVVPAHARLVGVMDFPVEFKPDILLLHDQPQIEQYTQLPALTWRVDSDLSHTVEYIREPPTLALEDLICLW